jgi:hypothetical protein
MVGVAPPGFEELKKHAASASAPTTAASGDAPARSAAAPVKSPPAALKGTMIGLAPPNMGADVEAAKAKLAAQKAQAAAAKAALQEASESAEAAAAAPTPTAAATSAASTAAAASKGPPAQLKGTMIGVAPPNMQAQIAAARDAASAKKAEAERAAEVGEGTQAEPPVAENEPPSEPDPLGGTVVGMSPFAPGGPHHAHAQAAAPSALDFNDDTPPAGSGTPIVSGEALAASYALAEEPAMQAAPLPQEVRPAPSPHYSPVDAPVGLPVKKSTAGPLVIVVVLLLIVAAGVAFLTMGKGDADKASGDEKAGDAAGTTEPAANAPKE